MKTQYVITGKDRNNKRFKFTTDNFMHAMGINLFQGSVYEIVGNKRKLIKRVKPSLMGYCEW